MPTEPCCRACDAEVDLNSRPQGHLREVEIGRDYGDSLEVARGEDGETMIVNPGDAVREGAKVDPAGCRGIRALKRGRLTDSRPLGPRLIGPPQ